MYQIYRLFVAKMLTLCSKLSRSILPCQGAFAGGRLFKIGATIVRRLRASSSRAMSSAARYSLRRRRGRASMETSSFALLRTCLASFVEMTSYKVVYGVTAISGCSLTGMKISLFMSLPGEATTKQSPRLRSGISPRPCGASQWHGRYCCPHSPLQNPNGSLMHWRVPGKLFVPVQSSPVEAFLSVMTHTCYDSLR